MVNRTVSRSWAISLVVVASAWMPVGLSAQEHDTLRQQIITLAAELMKEHKVPGMAITVIRDGKVDWFHSLGWANKKEKKPITRDTIFNTKKSSVRKVESRSGWSSQAPPPMMRRTTIVSRRSERPARRFIGSSYQLARAGSGVLMRRPAEVW